MTNQKPTQLKPNFVRNSNIPKANVFVISFKICYCNKASKERNYDVLKNLPMMNKYET